MCSECEEAHHICDWCGEECGGGCDDPDKCPSCWYNQNYDEDDSSIGSGMRDELMDDCFDQDCRCNCHGGCIQEVLDEDGETIPNKAFVRKGTYSFLSLPGEIRMKIYRYAFSQQGEQRQGPNHRGSIHTNLLSTCRKVYAEARHLPLTLNRLCFSSGYAALYFLGFRLAPTVKHLFTGLDIEFHLLTYSSLPFLHLLQELEKMPITHLGLTVKGGYPPAVLMGHTCFVNHLKPIRSLTSLDLKLTSFQVTRQQNLDIQEDMRIQLIEGYGPKKPKKLGKSSRKKRNAPTEEDIKGPKPSKRPKKAPKQVKEQQRFKNKKRELQGLEEQSETSLKARLNTKQEMLVTHGLLQTYANNLDPEASPVKIRLEQARQAAAEGNEKKFSTLAFSIWETLEEQGQKVSDARGQLPAFMQHSAFSKLEVPAFMRNAESSRHGNVIEKGGDEGDITKLSQSSLEL